MKKQHRSLTVRLGAAVLLSSLALTGCGSSGGSSSGGSSDKKITIGYIDGWTDGTSTAYLYKNLLQKKGYQVEIKTLSDNAPAYTALANGDIDLLSSAWPERTQKSYMDKYGSQIADLDTWYKGASLFLAVPKSSPIKSISDLPKNAGQLQGKIIGIEPGAGLTKVTKTSVMPKYGLTKSFKLITSSTTAMLAELKNDIGSKKPVVVTLWKPFWANQSFPVRPLADPKKAFGPAEGLHTLGRKDFAQDQPAAANMIKHFHMTDQQYGTLENDMVNKYKKQYDKAATAWLKQNPKFGPKLLSYLKK